MSLEDAEILPALAFLKPILDTSAVTQDQTGAIASAVIIKKDWKMGPEERGSLYFITFKLV